MTVLTLNKEKISNAIPLSHSAEQNFRLVHVFLNSSFSWLNFSNYVSGGDNVFFRSR